MPMLVCWHCVNALHVKRQKRTRELNQAMYRFLPIWGGGVSGCYVPLVNVGPYRNSAESKQDEQSPNSTIPAPTSLNSTSAELSKPTPSNIKLHPELAAAFLKHEVAAAARIWLLLRESDADGRGWIAVVDARQQLTDKASHLRICGWRQLRNLLHTGSGVFWERDKEQIWLRSVAKVAHQLEVDRLSRPIAIPNQNALSQNQNGSRYFFCNRSQSAHESN